MAALTKNSHSLGFLYHAPSQKILLAKDVYNSVAQWTLLGSSEGKNFDQVVTTVLKLKLPAKAIHAVYDYTAHGKKRVIVYAQTKNLKDFPTTKNLSFGWFTAKEISKLPLSAETKQDLIVGRRVIDSEVRHDAGERTIG